MPYRLSTAFFLYALCGGIATIFDWSTFYFANYVWKWNYLSAVSLSFFIGTIVNFSFNKIITFKNIYKNILLQYGVFLLGAFTALLLTYLQMILLIDYLSFPAMQARMLVTGIMLMYNFTFHKLFTFGKFR